MPNRTPNHSHKRDHRGGNQAMGGFRDEVEETGAEGREQEDRHGVGQQMREGYQRIGAAVGQRYRRAEDLVSRHPTSSVLLGFSLGLGLGVLMTIALSQPEEPWWRRDWRLSESLRHLQDRVGQLSHRS
jgi:hypothetical protein